MWEKFKICFSKQKQNNLCIFPEFCELFCLHGIVYSTQLDEAFVFTVKPFIWFSGMKLGSCLIPLFKCTIQCLRVSEYFPS